MSNPYQTPGPHDAYGQPQQPGYGQPQQPAGYGYPQQPPAPQAPGYGYPQQQPQYAQPQQPAFVPTGAPNNQLATASVALGFVAILTICFYGGFLGLVGIGLGIAGINRANQSGVGKNAAIGGVVLNTLALLIGIAVIVFYVVVSKQ